MNEQEKKRIKRNIEKINEKLDEVVSEDRKASMWLTTEQMKMIRNAMETDRKRDPNRLMFASSAMQTLLSNSLSSMTPDQIASKAFEIADAMMKHVPKSMV